MSNQDKPVDPEKERRKIKSVKKMKDIMTHYYIDAKTAGETGKKVAWITSGGPVEPLIAMDVIPVYPENHGAMIGASKMGVDLCEKAEGMGYSGDLCTYALADIACSPVDGGPIGGLPKPDMLVCCNNICGTVLKWYEVQARYYDVPLFILDTPFCHTEFSAEARQYVRRQLDEYLVFLETACGKTCDRDRLQEVGRLSMAGQRLWQAVLDTTVNKPAPMSAFDAFFHLALIVTLRGTQTVIDYYTELLAEMQTRVAEGISAVPDEQHRLLWDNLPIWFKMRRLEDFFESHECTLVAMGVHLLDNLHLGWLMEACAELSQWDFQLTVSPALMRSLTSSSMAAICPGVTAAELKSKRRRSAATREPACWTCSPRM